jgi:hypothetical protein
MMIAILALTPSNYHGPLFETQGTSSSSPQDLASREEEFVGGSRVQDTKSRANIKSRNSLKGTQQISPHEARSCILGTVSEQATPCHDLVWATVTPMLFCLAYPRELWIVYGQTYE